MSRYTNITKQTTYISKNIPVQKILLFFFGVIASLNLPAQNLVVNPDAESLPRGTGWTIVNAGVTTCSSAPTNTYNNWTMIPDGSADHPFDHTTGAAGGTIFFAGCNPFSFPAFTRFELFQDIDVSADATNIDLGVQPFTFSGYIQTPVSGQTDRGRFVVRYLDASNAVLGSPYTSAWQSNFGGSGTAWAGYNNTTLAPVGTRKVRITLQAELNVNQFEINAYFDDISLTKSSVVPVKLISFTGNENEGKIYVDWIVADEVNLLRYELEQSTDGSNFTRIAAIESGKTNYSFIDGNTNAYADKCYYRLKMLDVDGKFLYSSVLPVKIKTRHTIMISPNPANNFVAVSGLEKPGKITIINSNGGGVYSANATTQSIRINISHLPAGLYIICFADGHNTVYKKLVVQR
jgi:hypothetical protein